MLTLYKTINSNGEYSCGDIGITTDDWIELLHKEKAKQYIDALVCFLREPEQRGTCSAVGVKYGKPAQHFNSKITGFSEWVQKELGRFNVVGIDGNATYWCIAMQKGWDTKQGFVWLLRDELAEALRTYLMECLIAKYRTLKPFNGHDEIYKWELIARTNAKSDVEIARSVVGQNIIDNQRSDAVLKYLADNGSEDFKDCLKQLFDESKPLDDRLAGYKSRMMELPTLSRKHFANDERTAAALLTCRYPEIYTFYKDEVYQLICQYFGFENRKAGKKFSHFIEIINNMADKCGDAVQDAMSNEIGRFDIKPKKLAIQTLFWCMREIIKTELENVTKNYWLVGYAYGSTNSQLDRFFEDHIWESRYNSDSKGDLNLLRLAKCIKPGDILILKSTSTKGQKHNQPFMRLKGVGVVEGDVTIENDDQDKVYRCKVNYISQEEVDFDGPVYGAYRKTIHQADTKIQPIIDYINSLLLPVEPIMNKRYSKYIELLMESHNLVLTGAPGTGKTFMAQSIADEMGAEMRFVQFHPSYDYTDFVEGLRPVDNGNGQIGFERKDGVFKEFCKNAIKNIVDSKKSVENLTKEQSWQDKLEQFVEEAMESGKKFKTVNGSEFNIADIKGHTIVVHNEQNEKTTDVAVNADEILDLLSWEVELKNVRDIRNHYGRKFGTQPDSYAFVIVKEIRAMKTKTSATTVNKVEKKPFVLIIDEINRGEASKIFGELFYAIDPGYRGKTNVLVQTQYQNLVPESDVFAKGFYVPENVYILATMNDIDRSVESMDFAMRRRFTWQEVTPADTQDMLDSLDCSAEAKDAMSRLNQIIANTDGLGAAYMIGPSYFLKLKDNGGDFDKLWTMNIEPLLKEYLRGFRKATETLERFKAAYYKKEEVTANTADLFDEEN